MFALQPSKCTECRICMEICSITHTGLNTTKRSRIWVEEDWPETPAIRVCLACETRGCIEACPAGALSWNGWVRVDSKACESCGLCEEACPVGGIRMDPETNLPMICDTCSGEFHCLRWCPTKAIERGSNQ